MFFSADKNAQKSFAKPTTSYLRKASVAVTKRPTSAAANTTTGTVSSASSVTSIPGSRITKNYLNGTLSNSGKPRPPTTLLTLAAARSTSNSANSSRRSSINSPTKPASLNSSKKDILNQLQYYEGLCYDRMKQIENLEQDLYKSSRTTLGLLTMSAYILNEVNLLGFYTLKLLKVLFFSFSIGHLLHQNWKQNYPLHAKII